jgi:hypothetical protein
VDPAFKTDKLTYHGYFPEYVRLAAELGPSARVCELGVESGESLRMWRALFPLAEIYGVDSNEHAIWPDGTVRVVSDQADPGLPDRLGGPFGLIVDDASHEGEPTRRSFGLLWPLVQPGGYYVIEDWTVALREDPHWGAAWGDSMLRCAESFLPMLDKRDGIVEEIRYRYGMIIIRKNTEAALAELVSRGVMSIGQMRAQLNLPPWNLPETT